ncbi:MAG: FkbM family methyltransferase [Dehalococcoidia bacterium]
MDVGHVAVVPMDFPGRQLLIRADGDVEGWRSEACRKEPETYQWLRNVIGEGTVLYDIGACVGSYALIAAALGAEVHAFEPVGTSFGHLVENTMLNDLQGRITCHPVALAETTGLAEIRLQWPYAGVASHSWNGKRRQGDGSFRFGINVIQERLDDFASRFKLPMPGAVKIDVDGREPNVIEGGREVLSEASSIMVESNIDKGMDTRVMLQGMGFKFIEQTLRSDNDYNMLFEKKRVR